MVEDILKQDIEAVKSHVEENHEQLDLETMVEVEENNENREDLMSWLLQKQKRLDLVNDEERLEELLSHIEYAYKTAAISEETYAKAKEANRALLNN